MLYTVICRADLKPSAVGQLADRETYVSLGSESDLPGGRKRHYLLIEAATTAGAHKAADAALEAVGATGYELEVRGTPVPV
jgi:hypothetical protein